MLRATILLTLLAACNEHGKSPDHDAALGDAASDGPACPGLALTGQVRDVTNAKSAGPVTFTTRGGGPTVQTGADGSFALCGPATGFIADVTPPAGMLPGIAVVPVFGSSTDTLLYHLLVLSQADATTVFGQVGQTFDPAAGQLIVHQVLGELQPTLTGSAATLTGQPPTWMVGNGGAFVMFANVAPGMQRYAPAGTSGPSVLVPVEAGRITYVMSLIIPD